MRPEPSRTVLSSAFVSARQSATRRAFSARCPRSQKRAVAQITATEIITVAEYFWPFTRGILHNSATLAFMRTALLAAFFLSPGAAFAAMQGLYGPYAMTREATGTAWQPDSTPHEGIHAPLGDWMTMT